MLFAQELIALMIPWILGLALLVIVVLLVKRRWYYSLLLFSACIVVNWWWECIPVNLHIMNDREGKDCLKVMSFNMDGLEGDLQAKVSGITNSVSKYSPDILFITEFCEQDVPAIDTLLRAIYLYSSQELHNVGSHFYSKYPLSHISKLKDTGVFKCNVCVRGEPINIYGCHLASNNYTSDNNVVSVDDIHNYSGMARYLRDIDYACRKRYREAAIIAQSISSKKDRAIVLGDFNDVSGSPCMKKILGAGLKDAWWNGGVGYGATIHKPLPFRIDHIMYSKELKLHREEVIKSNGVSDHDALYAEIYI